VVLMSPFAAFVVSNLLKRRELGRSIV
jgi:hypothetical protein